MFAEAGKECVDFLFHILALPIGSVIRLLTSKQMVGCLGNLYESLENLDNMYIQPNQQKDILLKPKSVQGAASVRLLSLTNSPSVKQLYTCPNRCSYVAEYSRATCPSWVVTYMVLDDLVVMPMSTISSITLLNELCVKDVGVLKEKVVTLGMDEASLQCKNVLTSVFMDSINE
ncbi:hypothetical protein R3W88_017939 [Solanum pinnatisectum]|uniref:Uncharacterized protein n=1 Tax=Solanum pinnatisectum TaxID=50273 RepID=A0AAV9L1Y8_9SOLN|nr:hypothetical protein R3W88_017939 [Solanum pinnatisectum]